MGLGVEGTFMISKCDFRAFKGKPGEFMTCDLIDKYGSIKAVAWDNAVEYKKWVEPQKVIHVVGEANRYNDIPQVIIKKLSSQDSYQAQNFIPSLDDQILNDLEEKLWEFHSIIENDVCKTIWNYVLKEIFPQFSRCPGGVGNVHHTYIGGLMEHTTSIIVTANDFWKHQNLDRDILLTGALVHDIGKIETYNWHTIIEMSDAGRLLHHTVLGYGMIKEFSNRICIGPDRKFKLPQNHPDLLKLLHIIISHHEEEGVRKPMFPEAGIISMIDNLDAITNHWTRLISDPNNRAPGTNWTKYNSLVERQFYCPKPTLSETSSVQEKK